MLVLLLLLLVEEELLLVGVVLALLLRIFCRRDVAAAATEVDLLLRMVPQESVGEAPAARPVAGGGGGEACGCSRGSRQTDRGRRLPRGHVVELVVRMKVLSLLEDQVLHAPVVLVLQLLLLQQ